MAKRVLVHIITDCDGCDATHTELADGELRDQRQVVLKRPLAKAPDAFMSVKINNGPARTLCPICKEKLEGVFKAGIKDQPVEPPALAQQFRDRNEL